MAALEPIRIGRVIPVVFGVEEPRPFVGLPEGARVRLRMRNDNFVTAFIKTARGISHCYVERDGENWRAGIAIGRNQTIQ